MKSQAFKITRFTNPSGEKVWRVTGRLHGKRVRQNFQDRKKAVAFKERQEIERLNAARDVRTVATRLTTDEVRSAETVADLLRDTGRTFADAVQYFAEHYTHVDAEVPLADAVARYCQARDDDASRNLISRPHVKRLTEELYQLKRAFAGRTIAEINTDDLKGYLAKGRDGRTSLKTENNRRGILNTFWKTAIKEGWTARNPVADIPHHGKKALARSKGEAETLSAKQAEALMRYVETYKGGRMAPYYALMLFAGIRPDVDHGEASKIRPEHINLERGEITIPPSVSKVGELRTITIQPNLAKWLRKFPLERFPVVSPNIKDERRHIRDKFGITYDVCRHCFISFLYSQSNDLGDTARQAGNSTEMIRLHYYRHKPKGEVKKFWEITPASDAKIIPMTG